MAFQRPVQYVNEECCAANDFEAGVLISQDPNNMAHYNGFARVSVIERPECKRRVSSLLQLPGEGYEGWARHWSRVCEYPFIYDALTDYAARTPGKVRMVELGCGMTPLHIWFSLKGYHVVGLDLDWGCGPVFCSDARKYGVQAQSSFLAANIEHLPFRNAEFDAAYSASVMEHVRRPVEAVREMCRITRPGGLVVLTFDVMLRQERHSDNASITRPVFDQIQHLLARLCCPFYPPNWATPDDLLTSVNKPDRRPAVRRFASELTFKAGLRRRNTFAIFCFAGVRNGETA